jgi:hypothetical protein
MAEKSGKIVCLVLKDEGLRKTSGKNTVGQMDLYLEFLRKVKRGDEMSELHIQI